MIGGGVTGAALGWDGDETARQARGYFDDAHAHHMMDDQQWRA